MMTSALALGAMQLFPGITHGQAKRIVFATFTGSWEEAHRDVLVPAYRKSAGNAEIVLDPMLSVDQIAKVTAARANPPIDVASPTPSMPSLHNMVQRMPPVAAPNAKAEAARFTINWLSAAGTGVFVAALLSGLVLRLNAAQWQDAFMRTLQRMKVPVLVIAQVLGLGFLTRYSGTDAVLGLAFTGAGPLYPFFAAYLGWLGVFLTGSDTASNALFGSLQRITAQQLHLNEILIVATNSTGGVMGKMIDAQSIMVAGAACYDDPKERARSLGPIFRTVFWHSVAGAAVIGVIALLQAYVFPGVIPIPPVK